jgi:formylglycine-generating enzyme required for sulfatase activity
MSTGRPGTACAFASLASLAAMMAATACQTELPPRGQLVVHLDTDAPLGSPALFDRVLVEIFAPGAVAPCDGCTRELAVDPVKIRAGTFSFGFVPSPRVVGFVARLRLFRSAGRATPRARSTIELVGYLPAVAEDGIVHLTATFRADDVGRPRGSFEAPVLFDKRVPAPSAEGSWPLGALADCAVPAPPGASCVPGGSFFMGDPRVTVTDPFLGGAAEHLVVLSPFFLDRHEVTIAELRASGLALVDSRGRGLDPKDDLRDTLGACAYSVLTGPNDDRPVNCVSWQLARDYCRAKGGELPTEAQLERASSASGTRLYPWGDGEPTCAMAVTARNTSTAQGGCSTQDGLSLSSRLVPEAPGSGSADRVGDIVDVAANVAEWTRDAFEPDDGPCWSPAVLIDPVCAGPDAGVHSTKGGDLAVVPLPYAQLRVGRATTDRFFSYPTVGFRCAYPGR